MAKPTIKRAKTTEITLGGRTAKLIYRSGRDYSNGITLSPAPGQGYSAYSSLMLTPVEGGPEHTIDVLIEDLKALRAAIIEARP